MKESWEELGEFHSFISPHWLSTPDWKKAPELTFVTPAIPPSCLDSWGLDENNTSTEVELSLVLAREKKVKIHAVTGSVGKSTTVKLLSEALDVPAVGNIGQSLLEWSDQEWPVEVVMELSSFQLHHLVALNFVPSSFILTPVCNHHADWHGGVESYQKCKLDAVARWKKFVAGIEPETILSKAERLYENHPMTLLGEHNRENILRVVALLDGLGAWDDKKAKILENCNSLPHRMELVLEEPGRSWINDSKATSPIATVKAIKSLAPQNLILDGLWSMDPSPLLEVIEELGVGVTLLGGAHALEKACLKKSFPLVMATSLEEGITMLRNGEGDVLYSPGAPSYDRFKNYSERGDAFRKVVCEEELR